jgi:hypothetical protein
MNRMDSNGFRTGPRTSHADKAHEAHSRRNALEKFFGSRFESCRSEIIPRASNRQAQRPAATTTPLRIGAALCQHFRGRACKDAPPATELPKSFPEELFRNVALRASSECPVAAGSLFHVFTSDCFALPQRTLAASCGTDARPRAGRHCTLDFRHACHSGHRTRFRDAHGRWVSLCDRFRVDVVARESRECTPMNATSRTRKTHAFRCVRVITFFATSKSCSESVSAS